MPVRNIPPGFEGKQTFGLSTSSSSVFSTDTPKPYDYLEQIRPFLEVRRPYVEEWLENERYYDVRPGEVSFEEAERRLGRAFGLVQTETSGLVNARPKLFVKHLSSIDYDLARMFETLVNNDWVRDRRAYKELLYAITDTVIYYFGSILTTYEADFEKVQREAKQRQNELQEARDQGTLEGLVIERMDLVRESDSSASPVTYEQDWRIVRGDVASRRISPCEMGWDATARRPEEVRIWWRRLELPMGPGMSVLTGETAELVCRGSLVSSEQRIKIIGLRCMKYGMLGIKVWSQ